MRKHVSVLCISLALASGVSQAETLDVSDTETVAGTFRYTFFEGGFISDEVDDVDLDGEGFALRAGMALSSNWHIFGSYSLANLDPAGIDSEFDTASVGFNSAVSPTWDLIARAGGARAKINRVSEDGWMAQAGTRGLIAGRLEIEGNVQHVDLGSETGSDTSFLAAARFNFTPWFSIGVSGSVGGDVTEYGVNMRWATGL